MSDMQSLANQYGWTISTQDTLQNLHNEIKYVSSQYENMVDMLSQGGYFGEMLAEARRLQGEFASSSDDLMKHISEQHIAYIDTQKKSLQATMSKFV